MFNIDVSIYIASRTRWVHLVKRIRLPAVPRAGEHIKLRNARVGDYFSFAVSHVTYHEYGTIEVATELLDNINGRMYSFDDEPEFDEYYSSYLGEGWTSPHGITPNRRASSA